jgi:hypothetical protein
MFQQEFQDLFSAHAGGASLVVSRQFCPFMDFTFLGLEGFHILPTLYHVCLDIWHVSVHAHQLM